MKHKKEVEYTRRTGYRTGEKALTPREVEIFLSRIGTIYDEAFFTLAISTGIRRDDIVKIKQTDVDLDEMKISYFEHKKDRIRTVPINDRTAQKLRQHLNVIGKGTWLFPSPYDSKKHLSSRQAYNRFQNYLKICDIEPRPFHALRATCIKMCQASGWSVEETAKLVGDTVRVVQEHYTTPSDAELSQAMREKAILK